MMQAKPGALLEVQPQASQGHFALAADEQVDLLQSLVDEKEAEKR